MPEPVHWFIVQPAGTLPEALFLHVFDDGEAEAEMDWQADRAGALRFGSHEAALRFAAVHRLGAVDIADHPTTAPAGAAPHAFDRAAVA